jgi:hypothetical protein
MPDTGETEISHFVNAKEVEQVQESHKLVSKTKQRSAKPRETEDHRNDLEASERMVDEGGPNSRP